MALVACEAMWPDETTIQDGALGIALGSHAKRKRVIVRRWRLLFAILSCIASSEKALAWAIKGRRARRELYMFSSLENDKKKVL
jgi:hypothetical protein